MTISSTRPSAQELREVLARDGFIKIPGLVTGEELIKLRLAAQTAVDLARTGKWLHLRTIPKQFPPWNYNDRHNGIWGVQHLLHSEMPSEIRQTFLESYFHPDLISIIKDLLHCSDDDLTMELYNMLVTPETDFALRWHRDDVSPELSSAEELSRLQEPMMHAQWNLSLYEDSSLIVVPGSHRRARTEVERSVDPMESQLPGQFVVQMHPGDVVFYDNNILHRGVYNKDAKRLTLHGTIGTTGADPARARNILQHGIGEWAVRAKFCELSEPTAKLARGMQRRLVEMGADTEVGFSHKD